MNEKVPRWAHEIYADPDFKADERVEVISNRRETYGWGMIIGRPAVSGYSSLAPSHADVIARAFFGHDRGRMYKPPLDYVAAEYLGIERLGYFDKETGSVDWGALSPFPHVYSVPKRENLPDGTNVSANVNSRLFLRNLAFGRKVYVEPEIQQNKEVSLGSDGEPRVTYALTCPAGTELWIYKRLLSDLRGEVQDGVVSSDRRYGKYLAVRGGDGSNSAYTTHIVAQRGLTERAYGDIACFDESKYLDARTEAVSGSAASVRFGSGTIDANWDAPQKGVAIVSAVYAPGWQCSDGSASGTQPTEVGLISTRVENQPHIHCDFTTPGLARGARITGAGVLLAVLLTFGDLWWRRRQKRLT